MLLVEPETLLRRTVTLTARSLGLATVHEAASHALALRMLQDKAFDGALIAIDRDGADSDASTLALLDRIRAGSTACDAGMPIAVMTARCDAAMIAGLRARGVVRILLKPFKARHLIDTVGAFAAAPVVSAPPAAGLFRVEGGDPGQQQGARR